MAFIYAKTDEKGRIYFPKEIQEEFGFDECPVKVERKEGALVIRKHMHTDPVRELAKIGEKLRHDADKGKTLKQIKSELREYMSSQMAK